MMNSHAFAAYTQLDSPTPERLTSFLGHVAEDLTEKETIIQTLLQDVALGLSATSDLETTSETLILAAAQNIQHDPQFDAVAMRILLLKVYHQALRGHADDGNFDTLYRTSFIHYIDEGIKLGLLNPELQTLFDLSALAQELRYEHDDLYQYIGLSTGLKRYFVKDRDQQSLETPQFMWMRVAMGLSLKEKDPTNQARKFYQKLSRLEYIPGGSTNIGSGTTHSVLSNCYLMDTEDDIHHIFDNVKNIAMISKATGGIGIAVTKLRAAGSPVKSNNTFSTGPIPFIKVMDTTVKSVSRAGKKAGAVCIYMENWHIDFPDFLDLRQNAGDDYRRIRTANTAVYLSDEFMKRVVADDEWFMFDPAETPELTELYGREFSKKYGEYVEKAKNGQMRMHKVISAREQMKRILTSLQSTSHPWLTWKDTINIRALNNNTGTIHGSNLCTEVCLPQSRDNIAVCNLLYVNLARHIRSNITGTTLDQRVDLDKLRESVKLGMRHLDNLIDVNQTPLAETRKSDMENRAVGLGIMGLAETFELLGFGYDSEEAAEFTDEIIEFISYQTIEESCNLAQERGAYPNFSGSRWSQGMVPFDTIDVLRRERKNGSAHHSTVWELKSKLEQAKENTLDDETQQMYALFSDLLAHVETSNPDLLYQPAKTDSYLKQNTTARLDWDRLRQRVKQGVRNSTTMMIAPNASTGLLAGTSPGIDPRFSLVFSRLTSTGKFLDINHNLVKALKARGLWEQIRVPLIEKFGEIDELAYVPEDLTKIYKTSFQVSPYSMIEIASRAQKWIDQSMSRNMYLETRDIDTMVDIYTEAWKKGLKTTYYLHTKPRQRSEQSTIKINKGQQVQQLEMAPEQPAVPAPSVDIPTPRAAEAKPAATFGFGSVLNKQPALPVAVQSQQVDGHACPIDPAERANCEACQ